MIGLLLTISSLLALIFLL
uniref:Uncharacterized protein n=1 Tax=Rhizophora mucronata TaxID=61149 RepID=A0A2P2NU18_RHIMU